MCGTPQRSRITVTGASSPARSSVPSTGGRLAGGNAAERTVMIGLFRVAGGGAWQAEGPYDIFYSRRTRRSRGPMSTIGRSEAHTSELQSLMRISYAVLCLKKKTTTLKTTYKCQQSTPPVKTQI